MNQTLRPMGLGEILDRTFQIYRERFWALATICAAPAAGMVTLHLADDYWWHLATLWRPLRGMGIYLWEVVQIIGYGHAAIVLYAVFTGAMTHQASTAMFGEIVPARRSLQFAFARWRSFLWLGVLELAIVVVGTEAFAGGTMYGLGSGLDALGFFNGDNNWAYAVVLLTPLIGGTALLLFLMGRLGFVMPACAIEDVRGRTALQGSWRLNREGWWRVGLTWLLLFVIRWTLVIAMQWGFRWVVVWIWRLWPAGHHLLNVAYRPATHVLSAILSILFVSLFPVAVTLLYYDQRIRKEGFDVEWMMQSAGMTEIASAPAASAESATPEDASVPLEEAGA
jgi:hypothetical protein